MINQQLRTTPIIHDQRYIPQLEPLQKFGHQQGDPVDAEVGPRPHGLAMRAEWQCRRNAAEGWCQLGDHAAPHGVVHEHAVEEHDRRTAATRVEVVNQPSRKINSVEIGLRSHSCSRDLGSHTVD
jgi:hypothetical protein